MASADVTSSTTIGSTGGPAVHTSDLLGDAVLLTHELRAALHDQLRLVSYETQLAGRSLMKMVAAAVAIGVLIVSAWFGLMASGALALVSLGLGPAIAMLILAALNLLAAFVPYELIRRKSRDLGFPVTLRTLRPRASRRDESTDEKRAA
jgi:hypothetical protein